MHHYLLSVMMSILFDLCPQVLQLVLYILLVSLVLYMHVTSLKISTTYTYFLNSTCNQNIATTTYNLAPMLILVVVVG